MIVFGHYATNLKTFTPSDLGLSQQENEGITFYVKQRHAHIFWIPIFPIGKIYAMRRVGDPNLYEMPYEIKEHVKSLHGVGTPWYSFTLFILAAAVGLFMYAGEQIDHINYENATYLEAAEHRMTAQYPTTGDYYSFRAADYGGENIILKVVSYDDDTIELAASQEEDIFNRNNYEYSLQDEAQQGKAYIYHRTRVNKKDLIQLFDEEANPQPTIELLGQELLFNDFYRIPLESSFSD